MKSKLCAILLVCIMIIGNCTTALGASMTDVVGRVWTFSVTANTVNVDSNGQYMGGPDGITYGLLINGTAIDPIQSTFAARGPFTVGQTYFPKSYEVYVGKYSTAFITATERFPYTGQPNAPINIHFATRIASYDDWRQFSPQLFAPAIAPASLFAQTVRPSSVDLVWSLGTNNLAYTADIKVYRKTGATGAYSLVRTGSKITAISDTSLAADTQYYYIVSITGADGVERYSGELAVLTAADPAVAAATAAKTSADKALVSSEGALIKAKEAAESAKSANDTGLKIKSDTTALLEKMNSLKGIISPESDNSISVSPMPTTASQIVEFLDKVQISSKDAFGNDLPGKMIMYNGRYAFVVHDGLININLNNPANADYHAFSTDGVTYSEKWSKITPTEIMLPKSGPNLLNVRPANTTGGIGTPTTYLIIVDDVHPDVFIEASSPKMTIASQGSNYILKVSGNDNVSQMENLEYRVNKVGEWRKISGEVIECQVQKGFNSYSVEVRDEARNITMINNVGSVWGK